MLAYSAISPRPDLIIQGLGTHKLVSGWIRGKQSAEYFCS